MKPRLTYALGWALTVGTIATTVLITKTAMGSARAAGTPFAQTTTHDRRHMHMRNWALEPTGIPGVSPFDPTTIPKFVNDLTKPPVFVPDNPGSSIPHDTVVYKKIQQQLLPPGWPSTTVFAYGGIANFAEAGQRPDIRTTFSTPGPTFEALRGPHIRVHFVNQLDGSHIFPVDPTIMFANPNDQPAPTPPFKPFPPGFAFAQSPIPVVTHLHGGVTPSDSDGFVDAWFTRNEAKKGPAFTSSTFEYFNAQLATTLWYHDHTLGMTRLTVAAGLAGAYLLRERNDPIPPLLPSGPFEMPLLIQDRAFNDDGSIPFHAGRQQPRRPSLLGPRVLRRHHHGERQGLAAARGRAPPVSIPDHQRVERAVLQPEAVKRHVVRADWRRRQLSPDAGHADRGPGRNRRHRRRAGGRTRSSRRPERSRGSASGSLRSTRRTRISSRDSTRFRSMPRPDPDTCGIATSSTTRTTT